MHKNIFVKLFVLITMVAFSNIASFADTRIRFARGRTSATVTGRVGTGGRVCYFAGARAGQRFTATISSRSGKVAIFESGETTYNYVVDVSGNQSVCVDNMAGATTYSLTVSIM
ncbi:MAG: hypothetical protein HOP17_08365 [Acidobacteria bacterium]|nr:hypothetical protein [Acidobacteriota bacterium]